MTAAVPPHEGLGGAESSAITTIIPTAVGSEKAAAVLKVAGPPGGDGQSARQVALSGFLRERRPDTVRDWVHCYKVEL